MLTRRTLDLGPFGAVHVCVEPAPFVSLDVAFFDDFVSLWLGSYHVWLWRTPA